MSQINLTDLGESRERLSDKIFSARTLPEIADAEDALRQWLQDHPDEPGMRDGFEVLSHMRDFAAWLVERPDDAERVESRRRVTAQVYHAQTSDEIIRAREALNEWQCGHPEDDRLDTEKLFLDMLQEALPDDAHTIQEMAKTPAHV